MTPNNFVETSPGFGSESKQDVEIFHDNIIEACHCLICDNDKFSGIFLSELYLLPHNETFLASINFNQGIKRLESVINRKLRTPKDIFH